jgi:hypothetical protein
VLGDIKDVAGHIPASVGENEEWAAIVNAAEENRASYCKGLHGWPLSSALYGIFTVTLKELKAMHKARTLAGQTNLPKATGQQTKKEDDFQEVRRRRRRATDENTGTSKKATVQTSTSPALNILYLQRRSAPETFSPPLRTTEMDTDASGTETTSNEEAVHGKTGTAPPVILMSTTNLYQLQK